MNMTIYELNLVNTTSMIAVTVGSTTTHSIIDRNLNTVYQTFDEDDSTGTTFRVTFTAQTVLDTIVLQNTNHKRFRITHNASASNYFSLTSDCPTQTTGYYWNSTTNMFLPLINDETMTAFEIRGSTTMVSNEDKYVGELWLLKKYMTFDYNPQASHYRPQLDRKEYLNKGALGGYAQLYIEDVYKNSLKFQYLSNDEVDLLKNLYMQDNAFVFAPFPTGTGWDGQIYEVNWTNNFTFHKPAKNDTSEYGWVGTMEIVETPR